MTALTVAVSEAAEQAAGLPRVAAPAGGRCSWSPAHDRRSSPHNPGTKAGPPQQVRASRAPASTPAPTDDRSAGDRRRTEDWGQGSWATEPSASADDEPFYPNCDTWLREWLLPTSTRPLVGQERVWYPQWWPPRPQAVSRVKSLWRAWETLRLDVGTGMSTWWRDHGDHHLPVLTATTGPFKGCDPARGHTSRPTTVMPVADVPTGLFG